MDKKQMNEQAELAFDFIEKLNYEISYLIKEIEGILGKEDEKFVIGKSKGYAITALTSNHLDFPDEWVTKKLGVFFVPKENTKISGGTTKTSLQKDLNIIFLGLSLSDKTIRSPKIVLGNIYCINVKKKYEAKWKKFEDWIGHMFRNQGDIFNNFENAKFLEYEDNYIKFKGKFVVKDLFEINSTQDIQKKLIEPVLKEYRGIK